MATYNMVNIYKVNSNKFVCDIERVIQSSNPLIETGVAYSSVFSSALRD